MKVVKIQGKGTHLNTIEKYYIHRETLGKNILTASIDLVGLSHTQWGCDN
jgi:hypothetical protein